MTLQQLPRCYGQKIINSETDSVAKIELLSRFQDPKIKNIEEYFGSLPPEALLSLSLYQLEIAQDFYRNFQVCCSVNIDNKVLLDESCRSRLLEAASNNDVPVIFEFTEIFPMPDADLVNPIFNELRAYQISVALDDFGTGFNGMSLLIDYDFDIIKVDRVLITDIHLRRKKAQVLEMIGAMIKSIDKEHVVEGVEDLVSLNALVDMGFSVFQGFYFHKPVPIEDIVLASPSSLPVARGAAL